MEQNCDNCVHAQTQIDKYPCSVCLGSIGPDFTHWVHGKEEEAIEKKCYNCKYENASDNSEPCRSCFVPANWVYEITKMKSHPSKKIKVGGGGLFRELFVEDYPSFTTTQIEELRDMIIEMVKIEALERLIS